MASLSLRSAVSRQPLLSVARLSMLLALPLTALLPAQIGQASPLYRIPLLDVVGSTPHILVARIGRVERSQVALDAVVAWQEPLRGDLPETQQITIWTEVRPPPPGPSGIRRSAMTELSGYEAELEEGLVAILLCRGETRRPPLGPDETDDTLVSAFSCQRAEPISARAEVEAAIARRGTPQQPQQPHQEQSR